MIYRYKSFVPQLHEISQSEQATTPVDPRVLDAMLPYFTEQFGNPHSRTHAYGWEAEQAVETGRKVRYQCHEFRLTKSLFYFKHIADLIGADAKDIVFTSGATESNNMAIKGVARFHKEKKRHVITTQTVSLFFFFFLANIHNLIINLGA